MAPYTEQFRDQGKRDFGPASQKRLCKGFLNWQRMLRALNSKV